MPSSSTPKFFDTKFSVGPVVGRRTRLRDAWSSSTAFALCIALQHRAIARSSGATEERWPDKQIPGGGVCFFCRGTPVAVLLQRKKSTVRRMTAQHRPDFSNA